METTRTRVRRAAEADLAITGLLMARELTDEACDAIAAYLAAREKRTTHKTQAEFLTRAEREAFERVMEVAG